MPSSIAGFLLSQAELQTGVEFTFAIFPKAPTFFQPGEAAFHYPALGDNDELVQFVALSNLHRRAQYVGHALRKEFAGIAAVNHHLEHFGQDCLMARKHLQRTLTTANIGRRDMDRMRQTVGVDCQVTLDAAHLFAGVIAFLARRVGVLDALGIDNAERRLRSTPVTLALLLHLIFLMPAPAGSVGVPTASRPSTGNTCRGSPTSANHAAMTATYRHSSTHTTPRKTRRTNPLPVVASSSSPIPAATESIHILLS